METDDKVYFCDPMINTECTKTGCFLRGGPCYCVRDEKFAMKNQNGRPVECRDLVNDGPNITGRLESWLNRFQFKNDW